MSPWHPNHRFSTVLVWLLLACSLGALAGKGAAVWADEVRADQSETVILPDGIERVYRGAVTLRDSAGLLSVSADSAWAWLESATDGGRYTPDRYLFVGGVLLHLTDQAA